MNDNQSPQPLPQLAPLPAATVSPEQIYHLVGEAGLTRLIAAFYRQVPQDDILAPMYPEADLAGAERRLRDFLIFRLGGPSHYIEQRGHPRLRMRHAQFPIDQPARDRWVSLMERAIDQAAFPAPVSEALRAFFQDVATFLINRA
ncbi:MAG: hemin transporter [Candidatus Entotheonella factor]|uniref:Hemin transporter n=1 Tax=Entotheonella factor TaxID=1429438 RepID=W4L5I4_ENTF1|nr:hemin transporter [Candidatus Entotheonella palauensis]ETW93292.1 MAG: hemin transporter [Candidatus Entotheonella factor]